MAKSDTPFRWFYSSPEVIRAVMMMCVPPFQPPQQMHTEQGLLNLSVVSSGD